MTHSNGQDHREDDKKQNQNDDTLPSKEVIKKDDSEIATDDKSKDKFSPGEPDDYNPDEFLPD
jgi:hypothetical protein